MEKLSLEKFQDYKLEKKHLNHLNGGLVQGSSKTESCFYMTNFVTRDDQTDYYSDACEAGTYVYVDSHIQETILL